MNNTNTQVAVRYGENMVMRKDGGIDFRSVADILDYTSLLLKAQMLPEGMTPEGAAVSIIAGAGLGMNPFASVQNISAVKGRPTVWGDMMVALVKASGLVEDEKTEYYPNPKPDECKGVKYTIKRKGIPTPYVGTFSVDAAKKAGLWGKQGPWQTNPVRMMLNRARAFALRDGFADVLKGIRQTEEEQDIERTERMREATPTAVSAAPYEAVAPKRARKPSLREAIGVTAPTPDTPEPEPPVDDIHVEPEPEAIPAGLATSKEVE